MSATLARFILAQELCSRADVHAARDAQLQHGRSIAWHLHRRGAITERRLAASLALHVGTPAIELDELDVELGHAALLPVGMARTYRMVPVDVVEAGRVLLLAVVDPFHVLALDEARFYSGCRGVDVVITTDSAVENALGRLWPADEEVGSPQLMGRTTRSQWRRSWPRTEVASWAIPDTGRLDDDADDGSADDVTDDEVTDMQLFGQRRPTSQG